MDQALYGNIKVTHVVSFDNADTEKYVKEYNNILPCPLSFTDNIHPNMYFDIIMTSVLKNVSISSSGAFVIFLDDDDIFSSDNILEYISNVLENNENNEKSLILWKFYRNDKYIEIPQEPIERLLKPQVGDVATCSYAFNINEYEFGKWKPSAIGDFDFFKFIYEKTPIEDRIFINLPLTKVNYTGKISGWTAQ